MKAELTNTKRDNKLKYQKIPQTIKQINNRNPETKQTQNKQKKKPTKKSKTNNTLPSNTSSHDEWGLNSQFTETDIH